MSDLKYKSLDELCILKQECEKYITNLRSSLSGQESRLKWIEHYIYEATPVELSMEEIERRLGHKVILK